MQQRYEIKTPQSNAIVTVQERSEQSSLYRTGTQAILHNRCARTASCEGQHDPRNQHLPPLAGGRQVCFSRMFCKAKLAQDRKAGPFYTTDVQEQQAVRGSVTTASNILPHKTAGPFYSTAARPFLFSITLKRQAAS